MERYGCQFFGDVLKYLEETTRGHSVAVLGARPELITESVRGSGTVCACPPGQGEMPGQRRGDCRQSRRSRRPEPPGSSQGRGFCVCLLDLSRGKKVPLPSMKMYLTAGGLGEGSSFSI